jgi:hypothetical protein
VRKDVCEDCWKSQHSQGAQERKGFVSCWQGVYESPPAAAPDPIQRENAEGLLRKLIERTDTRFAAVAYILAVMLERKRLLKVREQVHREGRRVFIYEQPKSGDLFTIPDPQLQLDQLETVQHDVAELLEHGLPEEGPAASSPPVPADPSAPLAPPSAATETTPAAAEPPPAPPPPAEEAVTHAG